MKVFLMLGGNLGNSAEIFQKACNKLSANGLNDLRMSDIFHSAAEDCVPGTPDFCDAALSGDWGGTPAAAWASMEEIRNAPEMAPVLLWQEENLKKLEAMTKKK